MGGGLGGLAALDEAPEADADADADAEAGLCAEDGADAAKLAGS